MTLTIDLPPALEEKLRSESAREGVAAEEFALKVLEERLSHGEEGASTPTGDAEARLRAFDEWLGGHAGRSAPQLTDEAVGRDSIYRGREDRQL
ncbi:MAG: hypothetical protein LC795_09760 [Acidobacteria bacterium]|nr:hypothetical protein [Acidobacteriota bacterium]MCA1619575.1 hypothetical protein [Acidobacteriota bacterium]